MARELDTVCTVLFGSVSKGSYNYWSDIGLLIVAKGLPEDYFERLRPVGRPEQAVPRF
jgi:predicted nucleotidyltransferase